MKSRVFAFVLSLVLLCGSAFAVSYESDIVGAIRKISAEITFLLEDYMIYSYERPVVDPLLACLNAVLDDAENGWVITRPYVRTTYREEIDTVNANYDALKDNQKRSLKAKLGNLDPDASDILYDYFISEDPDYAPYAVKVRLPENGTLSVDRYAASAGDLVTVTASPAEGYRLSAILLDGTPLSGNTFTMPKASVCITAEFCFDSLLGDLNADDSVDILDAVLLFQHSMLPDLYPIDYLGSIDFTQDGVVDALDAALLFQYSMFPHLYPIQ